MQHSLPHITPNLAGQEFEERGPPCVIRALANNSDHCSTSGSISSLGLASGDSQHLESVTSSVSSSSRCGVKGTAAFPAAAPNVCLLRLLSQLSVRAISTFLLVVAMLCLVAYFTATSPQRNPANRLFVNTQVSAEDRHHHFISADQPQHVVHDSGKFHSIRCSYPYTPPDALCLQQATNSNVGCRLSLHRVTQRACAATHKVEPAQQLLSHNGSTDHERDVLRDVPPVQESEQQQGGGGLCPCHLKHAALVRDTFVVAMIVTSGDHRIGKMAVFSELTTPLSPTIMAPSGVVEVHPSQWALVDAGSCRDSSMFCVTGPIAAKIIAHEGVMLLDGLEARLKSFPSQKATIYPTADVKEKRSSIQSGSTLNAAKPYDYSDFCDDLRRNMNAVGRNTTNTKTTTSNVHTEQNEVFYAIDAVMSAPGHALELIINGLGIYARDGLHQRRGVPWIVPCRERGVGGSDNNSSSRHSIPQLFWTRFFLELNTVLRFPIYPVSVDELGTIDEDAAPLHPNVFGLATLPPLLRFSRMYLAPYFFMGSNQLCFKTTLMSHLWPHVVQKFQSVASSPPSVTSSTVAASPYRIAIMKSSSATDWRAFAPSPIFESLMEQNHITPISSYLPLLERMWHVNRAELLVTTWGSTMTTATSLMLPRQWVDDSQAGIGRENGTDPSMSSRQGNMTNANRNISQQSHQQRLLVLIHPGYCKEVSTLFRTNAQTICHFTVKHPRLSRTFYKTMSIHDGMLTDFDGGEGFCVKFLLTTSLDHVQERDFTFQCGQFDGDEGAIRKKQKKRH